MKISKRLLKWSLGALVLPVLYVMVSLILTAITVNNSSDKVSKPYTIYLSTNGVHLDIVLPISSLKTPLLNDLSYSDEDHYLGFGWGDANFYLRTPNWSDLTFSTAFSALFLKSPTLMHVTSYLQKRDDWVAIPVSESEWTILCEYIQQTFDTTGDLHKIQIPDAGYGPNDHFYKARGSYSCLKTCNSWVNTGFKESKLKCCLWTPFDFGLLAKYN